MSKLDIEWKFSKKLVSFEDALQLMQQRVENIINQKAAPLIWVLEHQDVYTAGVSAKDCDLLQETDIPIFKTNRGGKYTYHGPGMKIIYVMLDLKKLFYPQNPDVSVFVQFLEDWVIEILASVGIKGEKRKDRIGLWVCKSDGSEEKIAAIGIKLKKWVSYHGIAINISPNLSAFNNIVPCGIKEFGVTSLQELLPDCNLKTVEFDDLIRDSFYKVLGAR